MLKQYTTMHKTKDIVTTSPSYPNHLSPGFIKNVNSFSYLKSISTNQLPNSKVKLFKI